MKTFTIPIIVAVIAATVLPLYSSENAAPSSHFVFDDHFPGDILVHDVRVPQNGEARFTYYETLGWRGKAAGYAGIQAHPKGHNFIFSIWDHEDHRSAIRAAHIGPGTDIETFGGEGTGLKSWNFELGWKVDTWQTLIARAWSVDDHTHVGFWTLRGGQKKWTHLVTMDVAAENAFFEGGTDAFIEDWLETGKEPRTIHLRRGWKRSIEGKWHAFQKGRYSVNAWDLEKGKRSYQFRTNWNGGVEKDEEGLYYFMTTGGKQTKPEVENPSEHTISRQDLKPDFRPIKIKSSELRLAGNDRIKVTWELEAESLPQFGYSLKVFSDESAKGDPLEQVTIIAPGAREAEILVPKLLSGQRPHLQLTCRDILDHTVSTTVGR